MDYEKKYNEALKDMMAIYPNLKGDAKLAVEHAFPELAESEDERIRKAIVLGIKRCADAGSIFGTVINNEGVNYHDVLAYLEKQKEQKPAEWSGEDEAFLKVAIAICNRYSHKDIADWLKSLRPQPKQEWDDDDYVCFSEIVSLIGQHYRGENIERGNELINWLKGYDPQPSWKPSEEESKQ